MRNSPFSSGGVAASAAFRRSANLPVGVTLNVSPSSPSTFRRLKSTFAAVTPVAFPDLSRVNTNFSPWYMPRSGGKANTFSPSSVSGSISVHSGRSREFLA